MLKRLDLNLLVSLNALLTHKSVTQAARELFVTQPSMSGSLAKLRDHFQDPLLTPMGRRMMLSPFGERLVVPVREALERVDAVVGLSAGFDPKVAKRKFSICASEATVLTLLVDVLRHMEERAPYVNVELLPAEPGSMGERLQRGELDFIFSVDQFCLPAHPSQRVIEDNFLCVVWSRNRLVRKQLTLENYLSMGHVVTRYGFDRRPGFEQYSLDQLGYQRRVEVTCTTPALLGPLVVGTQRVGTMPARLAQDQAKHLPLKLYSPPLDLPPLCISIQWNQNRKDDPGLSWFINLVLDCACNVPDSAQTKQRRQR